MANNVIQLTKVISADESQKKIRFEDIQISSERSKWIGHVGCGNYISALKNNSVSNLINTYDNLQPPFSNFVNVQYTYKDTFDIIVPFNNGAKYLCVKDGNAWLRKDTGVFYAGRNPSLIMFMDDTYDLKSTAGGGEMHKFRNGQKLVSVKDYLDDAGAVVQSSETGWTALVCSYAIDLATFVNLGATKFVFSKVAEAGPYSREADGKSIDYSTMITEPSLFFVYES